jgi:heme/copper-type cytochrome/quinol oxidase subunit 3
MTEKALPIDDISTSDLSYAKLGTWLFLASEVMLFGSLFSSLILLRAGSAHWPHGWELLNVPLATLNTAFLITSSVTMVLAFAHIQAGHVGKFKMFLWLTILLGCSFLVVKYFEYTHKFHAGHFPRTDLFYATYFTMTGLHVLHVIGGLIVNLYFVGPGAKLYRKEPQRFVGRIECSGLYWHFVDLVWIFLFPTLYLI